MFVEETDTIDDLTITHQISRKFQPLLGQLANHIRAQKLNILICGAMGTGKSTVGRLLSGQYGLERTLQPYQLSPLIERRKSDKITSGSILVLPEESDAWEEKLKEIAVDRIDLVINVVSFGYHSISQTKYQNLLGYQVGMTAQEILDIYISSRIVVEIEVLQQLTPYLSTDRSKKMLMITLINKEDLWWSRSQSVMNHYEFGDYGKKIDTISSELGETNFQHEYFSASWFTENFRDSEGDIIASVCEGYDKKIQLTNSNKFLGYISDIFDTTSSK
jgi:hypothetical protein